MKILIVDDSNDKIANIITLIRSISENIQVDTEVDSISAQERLKENRYDLLVVDLLLPLRSDSDPESMGGFNLVNEITRSSKLIPPNYIIGLTQFAKHISNFPEIWNVLHYDPSSSKWKELLSEIIIYIDKSKIHQEREFEKVIPTIFVEGKCDQKLLSEAIDLFYPSFRKKVKIKSDSNAGANWVARQIIIWSSVLSKDDNGSHIKSIGLLDKDQAGEIAKREINRVVKDGAAGSETFRIFDLSPSYARHLIPLYAKGIQIPVSLEEMFAQKYWVYAKEKNWLKDRSNADAFLEDPSGWDKLNEPLKDYIESLGLKDDDLIYLKKFKIYSKEEFANYILSLSEDEKKNALSNFKSLIEEMKEYLLLL